MLGSTGYVGIDGVCSDCWGMLGLTGYVGKAIFCYSYSKTYFFNILGKKKMLLIFRIFHFFGILGSAGRAEPL